VAAADEDAVGPLAKRLQDEPGLHAPRAHDPHRQRRVRVGVPATPGVVGRRVGAGLAEEGDDPRLARAGRHPRSGPGPLPGASSAEISAASWSRVKPGALIAPVGQAAAQLPQARQWSGSTLALPVSGSRWTAPNAQLVAQAAHPQHRSGSASAASGSTSSFASTSRSPRIRPAAAFPSRIAARSGRGPAAAPATKTPADRVALGSNGLGPESSRKPRASRAIPRFRHLPRA